ncbi:MAG TPA: M3 family oligoendopeptidase [Methylibium sp.]|nr:M3 family oligoendopeptidase [Methylibium sp.]
MRALHLAVAPLLVAALVAAAPAPVAAGDAQRWDLSDLYPGTEAWDTAYRAARERAMALERLKPAFGQAAASMRDALSAISDVRREAWRLDTYADRRGDEDLREPRAQERRQQTTALLTLIDEQTAWVAPAVLALGAERVRGYLAADPALKARFDFLLEDMLRNAPHTLSPEGEALLAASGAVLAQPNVVYSQLADAELPRPTLRLGGKSVKVDAAAYERLRSTLPRAARQRLFDAYYGSWKKAEGTLGATLATQVQGDVFSARSRRFDSSLDAALFAEAMPPQVYRTLVAQTHAGLPTLHRYLRLRQRLLGIRGPLAYHDNYPPLVAAPRHLRFDLATSKAITLEALAPMGDEYLGLLRRGFAAPWTDSHPRPGKASGAYVAGAAYDVHPYVLLNHNDDFESLSTVAHEWGHAVHTMLATANQPFEKFGYSTFIAESASIANEMLLSDHLVARAKTRGEKLFYLSQGLESIRTTFFRQVMFAEFQLAMHEEVEQGRPLSGARLSELYCGLLKQYYGDAEGVMKIAPRDCIEWSFIPHFYYGYYVWQYATSMAGAAQFADAIGREGAPARERFVTLLKAGGSDHPYPLYRRAGIDMAEPAPYRALVARMDRMLDEIERLTATTRPGR